MTPDWLLLRRYSKDNSQEAFATLTARYLNLVYTVCLREVHDPDLAQDVTQAVFLLLARTAPSFRSKTALPGWLFRTARFASQNARTREQRRRRYEEKAAMERHPQANTGEAAWAEIEPLLNQSLARLKAADRDCLLLRFFQDMSFAEVGASLGVSEDAARKRVTRALEKLRHFFGKEEVNLPSAALAGLLTAHAAQTAPDACQTAVTQMSLHAVAGYTSVALAGSHAYQLTEGVMNAMKIAQLKFAVGMTAAVVFGTAATYGIVRSAASDAKPLPPIILKRQGEPPTVTPAQKALIEKLSADSTPSEYRTVALTGRVRRADGSLAGRIHLSAQMQTADMDKMFRADPQPASGKPQMTSSREMEIGCSFAHTRSDGTYILYVGDGIKYNIYIVPEDLMKVSSGDTGLVAAAAEGVSGAKGTTVPVPDLVLTPGGIVTGTVTDKATGRPIAGATVMSYGPHRPESSAAVISAQTNSTGTYRLRVAPGRSRVYEADTFTTQTGIIDNRYLEVAEGQTKTENFQIKAQALQTPAK